MIYRPKPTIPTIIDPIQTLMKNYIDVGGLQISFQRTVRVPEGKLNSLPAGLGSFPIYKVSDFKSGAPSDWREDGYFMPMYAQEAMWMSFSRHTANPKALVIGAGNINAISGKPFDPSKSMGTERDRSAAGLDIKLETAQNYIVVPTQPWLDGWKAEDGKIYQFVAAELGSGQTVEGQITGEEKAGGIQMIVYDPLPGKNLVHATRPHEYIVGGSFEGMKMMMMSTQSCVRYRGSSAPKSMGLGRGGEINQKIYPDPYGVDVWNAKPSAVDLVYLVSSEDFKQVTGHNAPPTPVTYAKYQELGLPWFELHDKNLGDTQGSGVFGKLKPVGDGKSPYENKPQDLFDKLNPKK